MNRAARESKLCRKNSAERAAREKKTDQRGGFTLFNSMEASSPSIEETHLICIVIFRRIVRCARRKSIDRAKHDGRADNNAKIDFVIVGSLAEPAQESEFSMKDCALRNWENGPRGA